MFLPLIYALAWLGSGRNGADSAAVRVDAYFERGWGVVWYAPDPFFDAPPDAEVYLEEGGIPPEVAKVLMPTFLGYPRNDEWRMGAEVRRWSMEVGVGHRRWRYSWTESDIFRKIQNRHEGRVVKVRAGVGYRIDLSRRMSLRAIGGLMARGGYVQRLRRDYFGPLLHRASLAGWGKWLHLQWMWAPRPFIAVFVRGGTDYMTTHFDPRRVYPAVLVGDVGVQLRWKEAARIRPPRISNRWKP